MTNIKSKNISIVKIETINPHPKNRNVHPKRQIDRLCKIIQYQGFRIPLIISNQTNLLIGGHGRLQAAKILDLKELPVIYQDFENEEQEYAAMVSDNAISSWAELDLSGINTDIGELGPDFNIDLLGLDNFTVEVADRINQDINNGIKEKKIDKIIQCPNCGEQYHV